MAIEVFSNFVNTTLASNIGPTATSFTVASGTGVTLPQPAAGQYGRLIFTDQLTGNLHEILTYTTISGDTVSGVTRGSSPLSWSAGDIIQCGPTAQTMSEFQQAAQAQNNSFTYALDAGGAANTYAITLTPSMPTGVDGSIVYFRPANANTGPSTLTVNGGTTYNLLGATQVALQGGEIVVNGFAAAEFNSTLGAYVLLYCTGGASQVANATQNLHALNRQTADARYAAIGAAGVVGDTRNAKMSITSAGSSGTFTADEIIVETALGGTSYKLSSFSQAINLAATGAGGMDTGTAPVSGFVAIYASCKAGGATPGIFACNVTTSSGPIYSGANAPSGVIATALIGIWPTNASSQFVVGFLTGRNVSILPATALNASTAQGSYTSILMSSIVPPSAKMVSGYATTLNSLGSTTSSSIGVAASSAGMAGMSVTGSGYASLQFTLPLITSQTMYYTIGSGGGTLTGSFFVTGYSF